MMMDSTSVSRRGMFKNVLALLAASAAWPNRRAPGTMTVAGGGGEHDREGALYWESDEYGRIVLVVYEGPSPSSTTLYYY